MNEAIILEINQKTNWRGETEPTLKVKRLHIPAWQEKYTKNWVVTLTELGRVTVVQPREV
jgi:hypothetical protein